MKRLWLAGLLMLGGCVHTSEMQLDANTMEITVSGAPVCGDTGTQQVAYQDAAIVTLRAGFDGFVILGAGGGETLAGIAMTPTTATTSMQGNFNTTTIGNTTTGMFNGTGLTNYSGGSAIPFFRHKDQIVVRMFRATDPAYVQSVPARSVLGPNWMEKMANGPSSTC